MRLIALHATILLVVVGLRAWWGYEAQRQLDAKVQAIRDRGEPIDVADFQRPHVPDADNAAWHVNQALQNWPRINGQLVTDTLWYSNGGFVPSPDEPVEPDPVEDSAAYLEAHAAVLGHLRQAADAPHARWPYQLQTPVIGTY